MGTGTLATTPKDVFALIDSQSFKKELARALPNALDPNRMVRLALTMIKKNSGLAKCSPVSIMACVVECAQLGLEPEGVLGHAYLVPFQNEATLIVGYRGFAHLMFNSGTISSISAEVVRKGDKFRRTLGTRRELIHEPGPIPKNDGEENWLGVYAAVEFVTGKTEFEYLEKSKIEATRGRSPSWRKYKAEGKTSPWNTDAEEMWRKTAIRRLAKRMPVSTTDKRPELLRAAMLDEYAERKGLLIPTLSGFEVNPNPPEPDDPNPITPTAALPEPKSEPEKPPKAKIPPAPKTIDMKPPDDPTISTKEQTDLFSAAVQAGWKVPEEVRSFLKKHYKIDSIRDVRQSQFQKIILQIKEGT